jgi:cob(I)alamin adenosyltransferase
MVQLTRIYTRGGDKGKTSLGNAQRVLKSSLRIKAIGDVDETNASIGIALLYVTPDIHADLLRIQNDLFDLGADLCMPDAIESLQIHENQVLWLEEKIDHLNAHLSPLQSFVLPGGSKGSSYLHLARAISRRAERAVVDLMGIEPIRPESLKYLNRLSDYLFVACRHENKKENIEHLWKPGHYQSISEKDKDS